VHPSRRTPTGARALNCAIAQHPGAQQSGQALGRNTLHPLASSGQAWGDTMTQRRFTGQMEGDTIRPHLKQSPPEKKS